MNEKERKAPRGSKGTAPPWNVTKTYIEKEQARKKAGRKGKKGGNRAPAIKQKQKK